MSDKTFGSREQSKPFTDKALREMGHRTTHVYNELSNDTTAPVLLPALAALAADIVRQEFEIGQKGPGEVTRRSHPRTA